jgi:hypothetical protein
MSEGGGIVRPALRAAEHRGNDERRDSGKQGNATLHDTLLCGPGQKIEKLYERPCSESREIPFGVTRKILVFSGDSIGNG